MVDLIGHVSGSKAIINVHGRHTLRTGVQHCQKGGNTSKGSSVSDRSRYCNDRIFHQSGYTLPSRPSIPATAITQLASRISSILESRRWIPATPTSKIRSTLLPKNSAVRASFLGNRNIRSTGCADRNHTNLLHRMNPSA